MSDRGAPSAHDEPIELGEFASTPGTGDDEPIELDEFEPDPDEEPRAPRSRRRTVILSSLLAVGLVGAAVLGVAFWQIASQRDATLTTPPTVAGLQLNESADGRDTADYLKTALSAEVDLDSAVGAVYSDGTGNVFFVGGTATFWSPGKDLDTAFGLISDNQGAVTGLHNVPPGTLGGTMKCGTTKSDSGSLTVCGWADHGSLALAMFPGRTEDASATLLRSMRAETQKRH